jgi:hypothetical protein
LVGWPSCFGPVAGQHITAGAGGGASACLMVARRQGQQEGMGCHKPLCGHTKHSQTLWSETSNSVSQRKTFLFISWLAQVFVIVTESWLTHPISDILRCGSLRTTTYRLKTPWQRLQKEGNGHSRLGL